MTSIGVKIRNHPCFKEGFSGFDEFKPINVIIGRNNVGKSQLLDVLGALCKAWPTDIDGYEFKLRSVIPRDYLVKHYPGNGIQVGHPSSKQLDAERLQFDGVPLIWTRKKAGVAVDIGLDPDFAHKSGRSGLAHVVSNLAPIKNALGDVPPPLADRVMFRLLADRDIQPEQGSVTAKLEHNGVGATNVIQRFLNVVGMERELVQKRLLNALNEIFGNDGSFTEIAARLRESKDGAAGVWEVFLEEEHKGLVSLSSSGSGLKTVILVLLNLLVMPTVVKKLDMSLCMFAFEELENNLHPALLRRLLKFIENFAVKEGASVFLTTHSSVALDMFGTSEHAQIIHVAHDGRTASTERVEMHFDRLGVISELGAKPSDLLQANGIIWVEGPSDVIYLNKWIELLSENKYRDGRDYQCAFYGGSLLARTEFIGEEQAEKELVNLLRINHNVIVVCDGDRTSPGADLKPRVARIKDEIEALKLGHVWVTQPKEIESYLPGTLLKNALDLSFDVNSPQEFDVIFPNNDKDGSSFVERELKERSVDKIKLAAACAAHATLEDFETRFDWLAQMKAVVSMIERWNK
jgi:putative ATP-dependent endonuclease of OLD family